MLDYRSPGLRRPPFRNRSPSGICTFGMAEGRSSPAVSGLIAPGPSSAISQLAISSAAAES
jgi:hypothetical protein